MNNPAESMDRAEAIEDLGKVFLFHLGEFLNTPDQGDLRADLGEMMRIFAGEFGGNMGEAGILRSLSGTSDAVAAWDVTSNVALAIADALDPKTEAQHELRERIWELGPEDADELLFFLTSQE